MLASGYGGLRNARYSKSEYIRLKGLTPEDPVDEHDARLGLHGAPESQTARQTGISSMTAVYLADLAPKPSAFAEASA